MVMKMQLKMEKRGWRQRGEEEERSGGVGWRRGRPESGGGTSRGARLLAAPFQCARRAQDFPTAIAHERSQMGVFSVGVGHARAHAGVEGRERTGCRGRAREENVGVRAWEDARGHLGLRASASSLGAATSPCLHLLQDDRHASHALRGNSASLPAAPCKPWRGVVSSGVGLGAARASRAPSPPRSLQGLKSSVTQAARRFGNRVDCEVYLEWTVIHLSFSCDRIYQLLFFVYLAITITAVNFILVVVLQAPPPQP